jgi:glucosamine--fructose-6-phosphate aminotransferase (isomerizing)
MCGIVGAIADRNVSAILVEGLKRLEYRGYDSAGVAVLADDGSIMDCKRVGKVANVEASLQGSSVSGKLGVAHTRWATHGKPSQENAHPHMSANRRVAVVHNGIIENHQALRRELESKGFNFVSETDTETVVHLIDDCWLDGLDFIDVVRTAIGRLEGAYALGVISAVEPDKIIATRHGSPLVIGVGYGENFLASDPIALRMITDRFMFLEEGDIAILKKDSVVVYDAQGVQQNRKIEQIDDLHDVADKGEYRHFMLKEIFEQSSVFENALQGRIGRDYLIEECFGAEARDKLDTVSAVQIVACGTSYHAGMVGRYWIEEFAGLPCQVEVASEFRYRQRCPLPGTLFVSISQSGETADTLAALRKLDRSHHIGALGVCNVANSTLVRESDFSLMTLAGPEIGVASTKAFTSQLVALQLLVLALARRRHSVSTVLEKEWVMSLHRLPELCQQVLALDDKVRRVSRLFEEKSSALFLGRGDMYPVALEGALKLKEISYIHAEAYPAGELKHGPLALVDGHMPVVVLLPANGLTEKVKSNLEEVRARGGQLIVIGDEAATRDLSDVEIICMPEMPPSLAPILYTIPLQLLSYHVAVMRGTDVDQPRNLAKSVTVE